MCGCWQLNLCVIQPVLGKPISILLSFLAAEEQPHSCVSMASSGPWLQAKETLHSFHSLQDCSHCPCVTFPSHHGLSHDASASFWRPSGYQMVSRAVWTSDLDRVAPAGQGWVPVQSQGCSCPVAGQVGWTVGLSCGLVLLTWVAVDGCVPYLLPVSAGYIAGLAVDHAAFPCRMKAEVRHS